MAYTSIGASMHYDSDGAGSYTELSTNVLSMQVPSLTVGRVDTTHLKTTSGIMTAQAGWKNPGQATFKMILDKTQIAALKAIEGTDYYFKTTLALESGMATPSQWVWQGFIAGVKPEIIEVNKDEALAYEVTMEVSGAITFTASAA